VALELASNALVIRAQERLHVLGIHRFGARGEADEVAGRPCAPGAMCPPPWVREYDVGGR
jgi:hypothetical protein